MFYQWRFHHHRSSASYFPIFTGLAGLFFILMVIFLVCSQHVSMPGTAIELPRFTNEEITPVVKTILTVTKDGKLFYDARLLPDMEEFKKALQELSKDSKLSPRDRQIVFYADQNVPLGTMAQLFDIARGVGFNAYMATSGDSLRARGKSAAADEDNHF